MLWCVRLIGLWWGSIRIRFLGILWWCARAGTTTLGVADAIRRCADSLRALDAGGSRGSESVEALLETRDGILSKVEVAEGRYRSAGNALVEYAGALERAQTDSLNALAAAK